MSEAPKRRNELTIKIGADSWEDLKATLASFVIDIERYTDEQFRIVSGGYSSGGMVEATVNEGVTHDGYMEALQRYLAELECE